MDPIDRYAGQAITPELLRAEADRLDETPATGQASWAMGEAAALHRLAAAELERRETQRAAIDDATTELLASIDVEQSGFAWSADRTADAIDRLTKLVLPVRPEAAG